MEPKLYFYLFIYLFIGMRGTNVPCFHMDICCPEHPDAYSPLLATEINSGIIRPLFFY